MKPENLGYRHRVQHYKNAPLPRYTPAEKHAYAIGQARGAVTLCEQEMQWCGYENVVKNQRELAHWKAHLAGLLAHLAGLLALS